MSIQGARLEMVNALRSIKPAVRGSTLLATSQVLVTASGGVMRLEACDFDLRAVARAEIEGGCDGFVVDHAGLLKWFSSVGEDSYRIEREERSVVLSCGRSQYEAKCMGADSWPFEAPEEGRTVATLSAGVAHRLLGAVKYAAIGPRKAGLPATVLLRSEGDMLMAHATDGHRAAIVGIEHGSLDGGNLQVTPKALAMASEAGGDITVQRSDGWVSYESRGLTVYDRQTEIAHPDYSLMPSGGGGAILVAEEVAPALARATMATSPKACAVSLEDDAGLLRIRAKSDMAKAHEAVSSEGIAGETACDFNPKYITDAIVACDCKTVMVTSVPDLRIIVIEPAEETALDVARHIIIGIAR